MYCQNCGTEIPEGGGFCSECGKPVNAPVQQAAHRDLAVLESNAENINPKPRNPHATKIAIGIAAGVLLLIIVGVALLSFAGRSTEPQGVHMPAIDEIEKKANAAGGGKVRFELCDENDESYYIFFNDDIAGKLSLSTSGQKTVTIDVGDKGAVDADRAYLQVCIGAIQSCDPFTKTDEAKEYVFKALSGDSTECRGVKYTPTNYVDRHILKLIISDEVESA